MSRKVKTVLIDLTIIERLEKYRKKRSLHEPLVNQVPIPLLIRAILADALIKEGV